MRLAEITWSDIARFISAIASLIAAIAAILALRLTKKNGRQIEDVHRAIDGRNNKTK